MRFLRLAFVALLAAAPRVHGQPVSQPAAPAGDDPFLWLEDVEGRKALDWVRAHNATTEKAIQADPRYQQIFDTILALGEAKDRIPAPGFIGDAGQRAETQQITNFWTDAEHQQGIWRQTTLDEYRKPEPAWTTLLDIDALSKQDGKRWVWHGANCWSPDDRLCLISLSDGGEDATIVREFDRAANAFVESGFQLPRAKQEADWEDPDTLLVGTDWGPGTMTEAGYPYIVKRLRRGQALADAVEVFRGERTDVGAGGMSLRDGDGRRIVVFKRDLDFFHSKYWLLTQAGNQPLPLPEKGELTGFIKSQLVFRAGEDFTPAAGPVVKAGTLASIDLDHLDAAPRVIFVPGPRQTVEGVGVTKNRLVAAIYDNVRGEASVFSFDDGAWRRRRIDLPEGISVGVGSANDRDDRFFIGLSGFLFPSTLSLADAATEAAPEQVKALPPKFDASRDAVDQYEATSKDGTKIPYFVVHPKDMKLEGDNPTLLYAYGGFEVSMLPSYSATLGKVWLERGGVYVLANIRGGGEFGPAWHEAALKTKRQTAYDDFAAVADDLITRKITSPRRLGIRGGSNGGLLMGVEFEQHPELWRAVVIDVPLLDMLRFEKIAAGASWVGEYGSVENPEERAFLERISPYANLREGVAYPEPFIFTTTKDDRVGPVHARKFAAKMEAMHLPFLYYEAIEGGHGAGANVRQAAHAEALQWTYLMRKLMD